MKKIRKVKDKLGLCKVIKAQEVIQVVVKLRVSKEVANKKTFERYRVPSRVRHETHCYST